jgi:hypothetical protein
MPKREDFDVPILFAISMIFVVVGGVALIGAFLAWIGWTGPLGLFKQGVAG